MAAPQHVTVVCATWRKGQVQSAPVPTRLSAVTGHAFRYSFDSPEAKDAFPEPDKGAKVLRRFTSLTCASLRPNYLSNILKAHLMDAMSLHNIECN